MPELEEEAEADILSDSIITNPMQVDLGKELVCWFSSSQAHLCIFWNILHDSQDFKILCKRPGVESISGSSVSKYWVSF